MTVPDGISALLAGVGVPEDFRIKPVPGGHNNKVYKLEAGGERFILKSYFVHPEDGRDRLGAEYGFSKFVWQRGIRVIPQPIASDAEKNLGLYRFVEGKSPTIEEISGDSVSQALGFFMAINEHREHPDTKNLPDASEANFSLKEHLESITARVENLRYMAPESDIDREAAKFVEERLAAFWATMMKDFPDTVSGFGLDLEAELSDEHRCISPSDFGFHNAIIREDGSLSFIDFEYAGWDDPARTVCDFFCQPALPVPREHFGVFATSVAERFPEPEQLCRRIDLLMPLYRIKWCAIAMNDFLPVGWERRNFAGGTQDREERKVSQLEIAKKMLDTLTEE